MKYNISVAVGIDICVEVALKWNPECRCEEKKDDEKWHL